MEKGDSESWIVVDNDYDNDENGGDYDNDLFNSENRTTINVVTFQDNKSDCCRRGV